MAEISDFHRGQIVRFVGHHPRHPELTGKQATVVRPVKSRKVVTIEWLDEPSWYDAKPENLAAV